MMRPGTPIAGVRLLSVDTETTGLHMLRDRIVSIGAVALRDGEICVEDSFEATLTVEYNTSAVLIHGITREESRKGWSEKEALRRFIEYAQGGVLVGHQVLTDLCMLETAARRHHRCLPLPMALDAKLLAHALQERWGDLQGHILQQFSLEELCAVFHIALHDRHTSSGDAFLTALLWQRLLRLSRRAGWEMLEDLMLVCQVTLPGARSEEDLPLSL